LIISGTYTQAPHPVEACQRHLAAQLNIPKESLILDNRAKTTLDNAQNVGAIMRQHHWKSTLLVTSRSHMLRAMRTLKKQKVTVYPVQVPERPPKPSTGFSVASWIYPLYRLLYEYGALAKYTWYGYME
jgi:uncharacterized SAM-binding protein YcdF (DUF218 family)